MKKIILVEFLDELIVGEHNMGLTNEYAYFTDIEDLKVLDKVVVCVSNNKLKVVTVSCIEGIEEYKGRKAHSWVVCKIDVTAHTEKIAKQKKVQEIRNQIAERKKQVEEMAVLKLLAESDDNMKDLLVQLAELDSEAVPTNILELASTPLEPTITKERARILEDESASGT